MRPIFGTVAAQHKLEMCGKALHIACSVKQCHPLANNNETHLLIDFRIA